jgi:hypothetical protein
MEKVVSIIISILLLVAAERAAVEFKRANAAAAGEGREPRSVAENDLSLSAGVQSDLSNHIAIAELTETNKP